MTTAARPNRASTTIDLPADLRSPALARRHVAGILHGRQHEALLDDALLLVSELVTNAVVHAGTSVHLSIDTTDDDSIRIEVTDRSPGTTPMLRSAASPDTSAGGRGLVLLNALATSWGTSHLASEKSVWFTLGAAPARDARVVSSDVAPDDAGWPVLGPHAPEAKLLSWLLMLDSAPAVLQLDPPLLLSELLHRLCDALDVQSAALVEGRPGRPDEYEVLAQRGLPVAPADVVAGLAFAAAGDEQGISPADLRFFSFEVAREKLAVLILVRDQPLTELDTVAIQITCGRLATVLIEQRLAEAANRARGSAALLAEASELYAGTLDADLALSLTTQLVIPRFGAWAAVWSMTDHGPVLAAVSHEAEEGAQLIREALATAEGTRLAMGMAEVLTEQRSTLIQTADLPPRLRAGRAGELIAVAWTARRRMLGVLLVAAAAGPGRAVVHDAETAALLTDVATRAAVGIDVGMLFKEQREVVRALQASLLPPALPVTADLEFGARYLAAGDMNTVGGDFYDAFALDNGDWVVLVGDVCGRGPEAAAITGLARSVLRVCLRDGRPATDAYVRLNREILDMGQRGRFCTSVLAVVRSGPTHTSVRLTIAGHPQPVLARADGHASFVGTLGTLIGVMPELSLHETEVLLGPGDALVLYTDGVTERRKGTEMLEDAGLLDVVMSAIGQRADQIAAAVEKKVSDFSPETARDDLALVVVRRPTDQPTDRLADLPTP